jgi:hypothetical protein
MYVVVWGDGNVCVGMYYTRDNPIPCMDAWMYVLTCLPGRVQ